MKHWRSPKKPAAPRPKRPKKGEYVPLARNAKPSSQRPAPEQFPILDGFRTAPRYFPGELLDNDHCIAVHCRGLADMAGRGGLNRWEIAGNLKRLTLEQSHALATEEAERIMSEAIVEWWRGAKN